MKIIDLLNKIANGEELENNKYQFSEYDYCTIKEFFNRYVVDKWNLNLEIIEEKKIPEKIGKTFNLGYVKCNINDEAKNGINEAINEIYNKIDEIIDYLKSKGE